MRKQSLPRDPMLHRPYLWEPLAVNHDTKGLLKSWSEQLGRRMVQEAANRTDYEMHRIVAIYGRMLRAGAESSHSDILSSVASLISEMDCSRKQAVVDQFDQDKWLVDAKALSQEIEYDDSRSYEAVSSELLCRLDDAELVLAILQPSEDAVGQAVHLNHCLEWVDNHFDVFLEAMTFAATMAESICISNDPDRRCLDATANKFMLWTQRISLDLNSRELFIPEVAAADLISLLKNTDVPDPVVFLGDVDFQDSKSGAVDLSLSAGSETSEDIRKRIDALPAGKARVQTIDIGNAGVLTIEKLSHEFRLHFRVGISSLPPSVITVDENSKTNTIAWNPLPNETSYQSAAFSAVQLRIVVGDQEIVVQLDSQ